MYISRALGFVASNATRVQSSSTARLATTQGTLDIGKKSNTIWNLTFQ